MTRRFRLGLPIILIYMTILLLSQGTVNGVATQEPDYFFKVHMIMPTSCPVRGQWVQVFEEELPRIGIDVELDLISWAAMGPRVTDKEVGMYSEGGYDIAFFGMSLGRPTGHPGASLQGVYGSGAIPPAGYNVPYWSPETGKGYNNYRAQESDDLIELINTDFNLRDTKSALIEWQKIWFDAMPNIIIFNQYEVHAVSSTLFGYDPAEYPLGSVEDQWFTDASDTVVLAVSTGPKTFNSIQATDVYSQYSAQQPMDSLVGFTPSVLTVLPDSVDRETWMTEKYGTTDNLALYPRMATDLGVFSTDGLQFNISVRDDIYWHDGVQFDAWDIAFSYQARLVPAIGASVYSNLLIPFGVDDKAGMHGNYSFVVEDKDNDEFFESISFQFNQTFAPWTTDYLGSLIYPEHILGDPTDHGFDGAADFDVSQWLVQPDDWSTDSTSTGRSTDAGGYVGPIGTGSQIFKEYNPTGAITLEKFEDIVWDGSAWITDIDNDHYNIANLTNMPNIATILTSSLDDAIYEMRTGNINIIDPQFTMNSILEVLQEEEAIQHILLPETGWQAMYMNPKFVQDGVYHFQKKGVRHAMSHIMPREDIIKYLMNGLGIPGYTPIPLMSWGAIPEEDLISYKRTLKASDNSTLLHNTNTSFDAYSYDLAFDWLDSEGYNTQEWRLNLTKSDTSTPGYGFMVINLTIAYLILIKRKKAK